MGTRASVGGAECGIYCNNQEESWDDSTGSQGYLPMVDKIHPADLSRWFSPDQQARYVKLLLGQHGLTRRQAQCFVRLWAYGLIKQRGQLLTAPLEKLEPLQGPMACSQREASYLFYAETDRGSDRAAGLMINQLAEKRLLKKEFDGNITHLSLRPPANLCDDDDCLSIPLYTDDFNPRLDVVSVAKFLSKNYNWMIEETQTSTHQITQSLRQWAQLYPEGMRVLRRQDNHHPVGFYMLFPTHSESEQNFFLPPTMSLYLSSIETEDPVKLAAVGDRNCYSVYIRSFQVDPPYQQISSMTQLLRDAQATLRTMQGNFPNLCELYAPNIYPEGEALSLALGFEMMATDPKVSLCWMHLALDRFLALDDIEASIAHLFS